MAAGLIGGAVATSDHHGCAAAGVLPDHHCTPGALNPAVTQANIAQTICVRGWTKTVRPPASYTTKLKVQQMPLYGYSGSPRDYEEDHLISLELGGNPTDPKNLWPEPWPDARKKDLRENALHQLVCMHALSLRAAQHIIATDWTIAPVQ